MSEHVRDTLKRGQRGFTLIELVAVMAILAVLVAIVAPAGINSERASITAQALGDSQQVRNAASEFFTRKDAEVRTPHTVTLTTEVNSATVPATAQVVSSRWPEIYVTQGAGVPTLSGKTANSLYSAIFETGAGPKVVNVVLLAKDGTTTVSGSDLLTRFTAIDAQTLVNEGLLNKLPDGVLKTSDTGIVVTAAVGTLPAVTLKAPNILWLFQKQNSSLGVDDDRVVTVFTLVKVQQIEPTAGGAATAVNLTYQQILGP